MGGVYGSFCEVQKTPKVLVNLKYFFAWIALSQEHFYRFELQGLKLQNITNILKERTFSQKAVGREKNP